MTMLAGLRVVVTRPCAQAQGLVDALIGVGATPLLFPTIEILPKLDATSEAAFAQLATFDLIIFVSQSAVIHAWPSIERLHGEWPVGVAVAAVGKATADCLHEHGVEHIIYPDAPPFDSEALLALPALQASKCQRAAICCGEGGRTLMLDTLRERGVDVTRVEVYQRVRAELSQQDIDSLWAVEVAALPDVIVVTSVDILKHFLGLVPASAQQACRQIPLIVVSERMRTEAVAQQFQRVVVAKSPMTDDIMAALMAMSRG